VTILLTGDAVGLTCAAAALVCRFGQDRIKRARAAAELFSTSVPLLGVALNGRRR
jgi:hypothetical protein